MEATLFNFYIYIYVEPKVLNRFTISLSQSYVRSAHKKPVI